VGANKVLGTAGIGTGTGRWSGGDAELADDPRPAERDGFDLRLLLLSVGDAPTRAASGHMQAMRRGRPWREGDGVGVAVELARVAWQCEGDGFEALLLRLIAQHERVERGDSHALPIDGVDAADGVADRQLAGWEDTQPLIADGDSGQRRGSRRL